jgi:signal transduction histidine kinase
MQPSATSPAAEGAAQALAQQCAYLARLAAAGCEGLVITDLAGRCCFLNDLAATLCASTMSAAIGCPVGEYLARLFKRSRLVDEYGPVPASVVDLAALVRQPLRFICLTDDNNLSEQEQHYALACYPLQMDGGVLIGYALFLRAMPPVMTDGALENGLLSSVSHDLRTPLTAIKAAVTGLLQEELSWDEALRRETLEDINEETDRLTTLVSALLEMSRIQGGALRLQTEWCDLAEIIHTVLDRLQKVTRYHRVACDLRGSLPLVQADFMQLDRVLSNLIENAVKYSPEGTEIAVAAETRGAEVWVSVLDEGIGIAPEERERIFEKFYRVKPRRAGASPERRKAPQAQRCASERHLPLLAGGSGLGLAICRGIVLAHGGRIWVEPRPEGGSRFLFTLPLEAPESPSGADSREQRVPTEQPAKTRGQGSEALSKVTSADAWEEQKKTAHVD